MDWSDYAVVVSRRPIDRSAIYALHFSAPHIHAVSGLAAGSKINWQENERQEDAGGRSVQRNRCLKTHGNGQDATR